MAKKVTTKTKKERLEPINIKKVTQKINNLMCTVRFEIQFVTPCVGTQPVTDNGLMHYVATYLKIPGGIYNGRKQLVGLEADSEAEKVFNRIKHDEIGKRGENLEDGELNNERVYAINVIRRDEFGHFLMSNMIKAAYKVSATRMGLFSQYRGSKGDVSEWGVVRAAGYSFRNKTRPRHIYLVGPDGEPITTHYETIRGTVVTQSGKRSIQTEYEITDGHGDMTDEEYAAAAELTEDAESLNTGRGAKACFDITWKTSRGKIDAELMTQMVCGSAINGLGGCRSMGYGRFVILGAHKVTRDIGVTM